MEVPEPEANSQGEHAGNRCSCGRGWEFQDGKCYLCIKEEKQSSPQNISSSDPPEKLLSLCQYAPKHSSTHHALCRCHLCGYNAAQIGGWHGMQPVEVCRPAGCSPSASMLNSSARLVARRAVRGTPSTKAAAGAAGTRTSAASSRTSLYGTAALQNPSTASRASAWRRSTASPPASVPVQGRASTAVPSPPRSAPIVGFAAQGRTSPIPPSQVRPVVLFQDEATPRGAEGGGPSTPSATRKSEAPGVGGKSRKSEANIHSWKLQSRHEESLNSGPDFATPWRSRVKPTPSEFMPWTTATPPPAGPLAC